MSEFDQQIQDQDQLESDRLIGLDQYDHIRDVVDRTEERARKIRSGELKPLKTISKKEQKIIGGLFPGDKEVIAGRTGTGKTAKALHDIIDYHNIEINPLYHDKIITVYDNLEMKDWRNVLRFASRKLGKSVKEILDYDSDMTDNDFNAFISALREFDNYPIYFNSMSPTVTQWYNDKLKICKNNPNYYFVILIDHTRLITAQNEKNEQALISAFCKAAVRLSNVVDNVFIKIVSQMNRNIESNQGDRREIGKRLPISSDLFGSDAVFQCADIVSALHRPGQYGLEYFGEGDMAIKTGYDNMNPLQTDYLLINCILKQRDGDVTPLIMKHNLRINRFEDFDPYSEFIDQPVNEPRTIISGNVLDKFKKPKEEF